MFTRAKMTNCDEIKQSIMIASDYLFMGIISGNLIVNIRFDIVDMFMGYWLH